MSWLPLVFAGAAGIAAMRAAMERGDLDEAARQGALAGPEIVARALDVPDRASRLAAIAAAPTAAELPAARAELLEALARVAAGPDRRVAVPAARAARQIARDLRGHARPAGAAAELPDDLAPGDVAAWRAAWAALAARRDRWIELRVLALDTAAALGADDGPPAELSAALADPDPALRRAAIALAPAPVPLVLRAPLAAAVAGDADAAVALEAGAALCSDLAAGDPPGPILDALGAAGLARLRARTAAAPPRRRAARDASRCLSVRP